MTDLKTRFLGHSTVRLELGDRVMHVVLPGAPISLPAATDTP